MKYKQKKATALKYDQHQLGAPKVTATGRGLVAENILSKAQKSNIAIHTDPSLVELLNELHINETIPPELYQAVAEVFAFVYHADHMVKKNRS